MSKPFLLFVDDEAHVLSSLRRMLFDMAREWDMGFAPGGQEALDMMAERAPDILITDALMPGMDGATLLEKTLELFPNTIRIVLSGQARQDVVFRLARLAHQYLQKPVEGQRLKALLRRLIELRNLPMGGAEGGNLSGIVNLPVLPEIYQELQARMASPNASLREVGTIIGRDLAMTAGLLKLVNSSFFGLPQRVVSPETAAVLLGQNVLKSLVLHHYLFVVFETNRFKTFRLKMLMDHCLNSALQAKELAALEGLDRNETDRAFVAAILHDVGKLILADRFPDRFEAVLAEAHRANVIFHEAEKNLGPGTHCEVGAYLLGLWGFEDEIIEAVLHHHEPGKCPGANRLLPFVHAANCLEREIVVLNPDYSRQEMDEAYIKGVGYGNRMDEWRVKAREALGREVEA